MATLTQLKDYLYCSFFYYLRHVHPETRDGAHFVLPERTTVRLPGLALSRALHSHASGKYTGYGFTDLVRGVWKAWLTSAKLPQEAYDNLERYGQSRLQALKNYLEGRVRKPDGAAYKEPRMSKLFARTLEEKGLPPFGEQLNGLILPAIHYHLVDLPKIGPYGVGDAFSESLLMAERYAPPEPEAILGAGVKGVAQLGALEVEVTVDLLVRHEGGAIAEIHDAEPYFHTRDMIGARRLEAIAAMNASFPDRNWPAVTAVVYRHLMSGSEKKRVSLRGSRLFFAALAAQRGIDAEIFTPEFVNGSWEKCNACPAAEFCLGRGDGGDDLVEHFYPGFVPYAERLQALHKRLGDAQVAPLDVAAALAELNLTPYDLERAV
jgi:hypothetical protein